MATQAFGQSRPVLYSMSTLIDLKVDQREILVNVPYPGSLGDRSFCGVEVLTSSIIAPNQLSKLKNDLIIREGFTEKRGLVTLTPLAANDFPLSYEIKSSVGAYMTYAWIKAPGNMTLLEYFSKTLPGSKNVMLHGIRCDDTRL